MATLSNIALNIGPGDKSSNRTVTVTGNMKFEKSEVGRIYQLRIKIRGKDFEGDDKDPNDTMLADDLYTFHWHKGLNYIDFVPISVKSEGTLPINESNIVPKEKLNEDTGMIEVGPINIPPEHHLGMPRRDEIFAEVTLTTASITAKSESIVAVF